MLVLAFHLGRATGLLPCGPCHLSLLFGFGRHATLSFCLIVVVATTDALSPVTLLPRCASGTLEAERGVLRLLSVTSSGLGCVLRGQQCRVPPPSLFLPVGAGCSRDFAYIPCGAPCENW